MPQIKRRSCCATARRIWDDIGSSQQNVSKFEVYLGEQKRNVET